MRTTIYFAKILQKTMNQTTAFTFMLLYLSFFPHDKYVMYHIIYHLCHTSSLHKPQRIEIYTTINCHMTDKPFVHYHWRTCMLYPAISTDNNAAIQLLNVTKCLILSHYKLFIVKIIVSYQHTKTWFPNNLEFTLPGLILF